MSEPSKPRKTLWKVLLFLAGLSPLLGIAALVLVALTGDLTKYGNPCKSKTFLATKIYTMDGKVLGSYYKENRSEARYEDLPSHLKEALISTEDVRYFSHAGVDFYGLGRAIAFWGSVEEDLRSRSNSQNYFLRKSMSQRPFLKEPCFKNPKSGLLHHA